MSELSRPAQSKDDKPTPWWVVFETHNPSEGIATEILTYAGSTALGITVGVFGEIKILVSSSNYERAVNLLFPAANKQIEMYTGRIQLIWRDDE